MQIVRRAIAVLVVAGMPAIGAAAFGNDPEVKVSVASGRQFHGQIDATSTAERLVLRTTAGGVTIRRPIAWERITAVGIDGQPAEVSQLREKTEFASQRKGDRKRSTEDGGSGSLLKRIEMRGEATQARTVQEETAEEASPPVVEVPQRATMIAIDPAVANWDADIETDGIVITVAPLDINRSLVPCNGTLEVELFAPQRRTLDLAPQSGGDTLELVERWTRTIAPEDFGPSGARLRLPFGAITPELRPEWTASSYGLVHARLAIPGQGVFEDSRDGVRVRPWAPNRDRLEMKTGQRFLSTENLGQRE